MSLADIEALNELLIAVIHDPQGRPRVQSFYDPSRPSWLVRSDPFVVHYAFDMDEDEVVFLNLFRRQ